MSAGSPTVRLLLLAQSILLSPLLLLLSAPSSRLSFRTCLFAHLSPSVFSPFLPLFFSPLLNFFLPLFFLLLFFNTGAFTVEGAERMLTFLLVHQERRTSLHCCWSINAMQCFFNLICPLCSYIWLILLYSSPLLEKAALHVSQFLTSLKRHLQQERESALNYHFHPSKTLFHNFV